MNRVPLTGAAAYNAAQIAAGKLTPEHVVELVRAWQAAHPALEVDGMAGPVTLASIASAMRPAPFLVCPLAPLKDGRVAVITSSFRPPDRKNHNGVDWFYPWRHGDQPAFVGDGGAAGRNPDGTPRWVVPVNTIARAAAPGRVTFAGNTGTGHQVWIDHGNGLRTGYMHLRTLQVSVGDEVDTGAGLGFVGDNPADSDGAHLHFEVSPVEHYSPLDPELFLIRFEIK